MFKERPTFSRCTVTHDVKPLLDFIKNLGSSNEKYSEICKKVLATLITLLNRKRSQILPFLKIDSIYLDEHRSTFYISKLLKSTRPEFAAYPTDKYLCVVRLISLYLGKASPRREKNDSSSSFVMLLSTNRVHVKPLLVG